MSPKPIYVSPGALDAPSQPEIPEEADPLPSGPAVVKPEPLKWPRLAAADMLLSRHIPQWKRMLFHVWGMSTAAGLCLVVEHPYARGGLVILALLLALAYEYGRKTKNNWFGKLCNRPLVREHEVGTRAASTDFGLAMAVMAMFFNPVVAAIAFLVAALADPMARLWGMRYGRHRWFGGKKTVEGSLACFAVAATVILMASSSLSVIAGLGVAAIAMAAELIPQTAINTRFGKLLTPCDNFYVPLFTGAVLQVLT